MEQPIKYLNLKERREEFINEIGTGEFLIFPIVSTYHSLSNNYDPMSTIPHLVEQNVLNHQKLGLNVYDIFVYKHPTEGVVVFNYGTAKKVEGQSSKGYSLSNSYYDACLTDKLIVREVFTKDAIERLVEISEIVSIKMSLSLYLTDSQISALMEDYNKKVVIAEANKYWLSFINNYMYPIQTNNELASVPRRILTDCATIFQQVRSLKNLKLTWPAFKKLLSRYEIPEYKPVPFFWSSKKTDI